MGRIVVDISTSVDGFVAGPDTTLEEPLGRDGERLHEWMFGLDAWRERHGLEGGERSVDSEVVESLLARTGAVVMGRRMWSGGSGPWEEDPNAGGWWGDEPPFRVPVFVLTHHARASETKAATPIEFVTEGIEAALGRALAAAGGRDVLVAGGANVAQQALATGLVDELCLHVAPVVLGAGVRLFPDDGPPATLAPTETIASPTVTHLRYRVVH
ncbi:MAG TPA: dihydrofolate reductase family protein [Actinomycetota bacterium]|nr:dihydrofolate reductase family protein [Actinomycetota bacterium]